MSSTIDGTAVATMVASIATRPVASISAIRMGPRRDRNPTPSATVLMPTLFSAVILGFVSKWVTPLAGKLVLGKVKISSDARSYENIRPNIRLVSSQNSG